MLPAWVAGWIGISFKERGRDRGGYDCWGICRAVWAEHFGFQVPSYAERYATTADRQEITRLVEGELRGPWQAVLVVQARAGDALLLRIQGEPMHVGVVVAPPKFLHVRRGANTCIEDWSRAQWNRRVIGVYRHEALRDA